MPTVSTAGSVSTGRLFTRRTLGAGALQAAALLAAGLGGAHPVMGAEAGSGRERRGYAPSRLGQVHYRRLGRGAPVLLIHQAPLSSLQFRNAAPLLAASGFSAIAVDLPGLGLSDTPPAPPAIADYADAMADVIASLRLRDVAVAGHQTGGLVACALAARAPRVVRRLVVHGAPLYDAGERAARMARPHGDLALKPDGSHFADRWTAAGGPGARMSTEARHLAVLSYFENGPLQWYAHAASYAYDPAPDLARIRPPALVLANRDDAIYAHGRRMARSRPDFAYAELEGGAESVLDGPEPWTKAVATFLRA